jgi:LemA protein
VRTSLIAAAAGGAVLLFWVIGAQNRLVGLRNAVGAAWAKVNDAVTQRAQAVAPLAELLREPMVAEQGALDTWLAAHVDAVKAAQVMTGRPVSEAHAQAWASAESALGAAATRLLALLEQQPDLHAQEAFVAALAAWREGQAKLPFARQLFNEAATAYNEAADLFPTRIVARGFRMRRAGLI